MQPLSEDGSNTTGRLPITNWEEIRMRIALPILVRKPAHIFDD